MRAGISVSSHHHGQNRLDLGKSAYFITSQNQDRIMRGKRNLKNTFPPPLPFCKALSSPYQQHWRTGNEGCGQFITGCLIFSHSVAFCYSCLQADLDCGQYFGDQGLKHAPLEKVHAFQIVWFFCLPSGRKETWLLNVFLCQNVSFSLAQWSDSILLRF